MALPAFAVLRVEKLKGDKIRQADGHNRRTITVRHRDPDGDFERRIGDPTMGLDDLIQNRIDKTGAKLRSDGVPAMEILLSASPDYFRPDTPEAWNKYDQKRMEEWRDATEKWLRDKYGENLISFDLHLDEATPHGHAVVTPIATKSRKRRGKDEYYDQSVFDAKGMFGKRALSQLQTEYANAIGHLGINRGMKKSRRTHETIKSFYTEASTGKVKIPAIPSIKVPEPSLELTKKGRKEYAEKASKKVEKDMSEWADKMKSKANRIWRLAKHYRNKYWRERQRSLEYWQKFGSPEDLDLAIEKKETQNKALTTQLKEANKKVENLVSERDMFYVPNKKYVEDVRKAENKVREEMQKKVENKEREMLELRAHYRNRSGRGRDV